ncbi:hypothetical protein C7E23_02670 [Elizabethkingia anophelis]|nr:hypothetical protein C7E23_02670 [Elizabethkingia anophelis]
MEKNFIANLRKKIVKKNSETKKRTNENKQLITDFTKKENTSRTGNTLYLNSIVYKKSLLQ